MGSASYTVVCPASMSARIRPASVGGADDPAGSQRRPLIGARRGTSPAPPWYASPAPRRSPLVLPQRLPVHRARRIRIHLRHELDALRLFPLLASGAVTRVAPALPGAPDEELGAALVEAPPAARASPRRRKTALAQETGARDTSGGGAAGAC